LAKRFFSFCRFLLFFLPGSQAGQERKGGGTKEQGDGLGCGLGVSPHWSIIPAIIYFYFPLARTRRSKGLDREQGEEGLASLSVER
jgi:hypothetical protein